MGIVLFGGVGGISTVKSGECATIIWNVSPYWSAIGFSPQGWQVGEVNQGFGQTGSEIGKTQVCPTQTTTYGIHVIFPHNSVDKYWTINVIAPQVPPAPPPPAPAQPPAVQMNVNFTASPTVITTGQCTTLRWDVDGVQALYFNGQGVTGHETRQVCPSSTTTYGLNIVAPGQNFWRNVTVTVNQPIPPTAVPLPPPAAIPLSVNFYAQPDTITQGQCTTLYWHVVGNNPAKKPSASIGPPTDNLGSVALVPDGSGKVCPSSTTTYTLYGDDVNGNPWRRQTTVTVLIPQPPTPAPVVSFTADDNVVELGKCTTLRWNVDGVNAIYFNGQGVTGHESRQVCPSSTTTYGLHIVAPGQDFWQNVTVTISQPPPAPSFQESDLVFTHLSGLSNTYQFSDADYQALKSLLAITPDQYKPCFELAGLALGGQVVDLTSVGGEIVLNKNPLEAIFSLPGNVADCNAVLTNINGILAKYLQGNYAVFHGQYAPADIETYCQSEYGAKVIVPEWDKPYDWSCQKANGAVVLMDPNEIGALCRLEYPGFFPNAYLRQQDDAFSWVCQQ